VTFAEGAAILTHSMCVRMLIRIIKAPPAPLMDGYEVRMFRVAYLYEVEPRIGNYLVVAGYAERVDDTGAGRKGGRRSGKRG